MWRRAASSSSSGEEHADDDVQALGIVHHGHAARQPLVVPDEMRGAEQGQQRQGAVEPAPGPARGQPGRGLGRVGGRLGQEPERDGEGHVHRELDQQVVEPGVGGVELEGRTRRSPATPAASADQASWTISPPTRVSRAVWPTSASSGAVSGSCSSTARSAAQPGASRPRSRSANVTQAPPCVSAASAWARVSRSRWAHDDAGAHVAAGHHGREGDPRVGRLVVGGDARTGCGGGPGSGGAGAGRRRRRASPPRRRPSGRDRRWGWWWRRRRAGGCARAARAWPR